MTDYYFACDAMQYAVAFSRHVPTYNYEFTEANAPLPQDPLMPLGALHGAELIFLFQSNSLVPGPVGLTASQQKLSEQMIRYWGRFAATGNPNSFLPPYWPRFDPNRPSSLNFNSSGQTVFSQEAFRKNHQCTLIDAL